MESQKFLKQFDLKYNKIASAMLTYDDLLESVASEGKHTFISTGMSTMDEIEKAVNIFKVSNCPFELMHCNITYPMENNAAHLNVMETSKPILIAMLGIVGMKLEELHSKNKIGATSLERHNTL